MPASMKITRSATIEGKAFSESKSVNGDNVAFTAPSVPVAKAGTLTARTDNDTGTATLGASHGITTGQRVDVYWTGGTRYGMTVGTVAGNDVPIDGGTGDNLPATSTPIKLCVIVVRPFALVGNNVLGLAFHNGGADQAQVTFVDGSNVSLMHKLLPAGGTFIWDSTDGETNELSGDTVVNVNITQGGTAAAATISVGALL